eukprot:24405-Eustigmatos_ZCMA.PRE.1
MAACKQCWHDANNNASDGCEEYGYSSTCRSPRNSGIRHGAVSGAYGSMVCAYAVSTLRLNDVPPTCATGRRSKNLDDEFAAYLRWWSL